MNYLHQATYYYPVILYPSLIRDFVLAESRRKEALKVEFLKRQRNYASHTVSLSEPPPSSNLLAMIWKWLKNAWAWFWGNPLPSSQPLSPPRSQPLVPSRPRLELDTAGRVERLKQLLSGRVMTSTAASSAQKGVSERDFLEVLRRFFPVEFGGEFPIPGSQYVYSADFQLIHESGLSIDIEVDEPYDGRTNKPHHCTDDQKDKRRNQFFLKGNWVVIRFAEIQVVKYPYECAVVVGQILSTITGDKSYQLEQHKPLPPVKPWTKAKARKMARCQFRQSYLPGWKK